MTIGARLRRPVGVEMRRQVLLDTLRHHPLSSCRELSDRICNETGGTPAIVTGSLWIAPWTVYADLRALERAGKVAGRRHNARVVAWEAL